MLNVELDDSGNAWFFNFKFLMLNVKLVESMNAWFFNFKF
jgi:hypothetical protein